MDLNFIVLITSFLSFAGLLFIIYKLIKVEYGLQGSIRSVQMLSQENLPEKIRELQKQFNELHLKIINQLHQDTTNSMTQLNQQLNSNLKTNSDVLEKRIGTLTEHMRNSLSDINKTVEDSLSKNFEKTNATFSDVVKRLTMIDAAQKKISELSGQVVDLQKILTDKRSRGAWGEVQLENIIQNLFAPEHYAMQHTLSNDKRVDCMLFLPAPTGNVPIDAKFPLETYRKLHSKDLTDLALKKELESQFKRDLKKHIDDVAGKYILPPETSEGVILFIPAEAIFADIHSYYPETIEYAQRKKVWLVSPATLMAILTTAKAVLKDEATKKQVHIIKEHLMNLAKDFDRFGKRMDNLAKHIEQANKDVHDVNTSAKKITSRFSKIEKADLKGIEE